MGLVLLRKSFIEIGGCSGGLFFFCKWLAHCIKSLDRWIQIEVQCRRNAELCECMFYRGLHKGIDYFFVLKFYFLLGGMHIDIDLCRLEVNEQYIQREAVRWYHVLVSAHHSMIQIC